MNEWKKVNRRVIIGNGFDMARGLKTSYMDFINWYWDRRVDAFVGNPSTCFQSRRKGTCHRGNNVKVSLREWYFNVVLVQCIVDHFFHLAVEP